MHPFPVQEIRHPVYGSGKLRLLAPEHDHERGEVAHRSHPSQKDEEGPLAINDGPVVQSDRPRDLKDHEDSHEIRPGPETEELPAKLRHLRDTAAVSSEGRVNIHTSDLKTCLRPYTMISGGGMTTTVLKNAAT